MIINTLYSFLPKSLLLRWGTSWSGRLKVTTSHSSHLGRKGRSIAWWENPPLSLPNHRLCLFILQASSQASPALGLTGLHCSCPSHTYSHRHRHSEWDQYSFYPPTTQEPGVSLIVCLPSLYSCLISARYKMSQRLYSTH